LGDLRFGGEFGPPEADEVKKCAKTYVKKPNMRANAHERYLARPKENADWWLIEIKKALFFLSKVNDNIHEYAESQIT
jgi:hypothetical protein